MGYVELSGTNAGIAQDMLRQVLDRQDVVTMLVIGPDHEQVAADARHIAATNAPSTWWVVWIQNPAVLTPEQQAAYTDASDDTVACVLSTTDHPVRYLTAELARHKRQLLLAFYDAEAAVAGGADR